MRGTQFGKLARAFGAVALVMGALVVIAGPATAATALSATPTFPVASTVGQTINAAVVITNVSTGAEATGTVSLSDTTLVPSCGTIASVDCPPASADPGVFQVTQAVGTGGACLNIPFNFSTVDGTQGKIQLSPVSPIVLAAPGGQTDNCRISLTANVLRRPSKDAQPGTTGVQTVQLAAATGTSSVTGATGAGAGASFTTVNRATPSLSTVASPPTATVGQQITDTATVTGVSNGPAPTSGIIFTVFADPPGAVPCSGPSQNVGLVGLAGAGGSPPTSTATSPAVTTTTPGTYRFVAGYIGDANYESLPDSPCGAPNENVTVTADLPSGRYTPLTPARILDTRVGTGGILGAIGSGSTVSVQVAGLGGVPASGVRAVAMNVTVTEPTAPDSYLTIYPTSQPRPLASNLNFTPGKTVPNLVVVQLGSGGQVDMFNAAGNTHVIYDVAGWFSDSPAGDDGRFQAVNPARIVDTRTGMGSPAVRLGPGASLEVQVTGQGGVPTTGAEAVVMNVAVTNTTGSSYLTVHPTGEARPLAANLNWVAADTVSNRVIAKLGTGGRVTLYNNQGETDVIIDTNGWFTDGSALATMGAYTPLTPARILDTRTGAGGAGTVPAGGTIEVQITGEGGVPASGVSAVIFNVTAVTPAGAGYLTIFPAATAQPVVSDLNYASGEIRPNLVVVKVGAGGKASIFTSSSADVVADVAGWFS